jgi:hypothetical protein
LRTRCASRADRADAQIVRITSALIPGAGRDRQKIITIGRQPRREVTHYALKGRSKIRNAEVGYVAYQAEIDLSWTGCIESIAFNRDSLIREIDKHLSNGCRRLRGLRCRSDSSRGNHDTKSQTDNNVSHEIVSPLFSLHLFF